MSVTSERWALITGVSEGGLGDALTSELLGRGVKVIVTGLKLDDLDYLAGADSARVVRLELDVTSSSSITAAAAEASRVTNGRLNFLFNNAGYGYMTPLLDASISRVKENFDVNVFGVLEMVQAFFPLLRAACGTIVNQGSIAGLPGITQPYIGSYSASKCAMMNFSNTLQLELAPFGVKVVTLVTGDVKTRFWDNAEKGKRGTLPEHSLYNPIRKHVEAMMRGDTNPPGQHIRTRWASKVVGDILGNDEPPSVVRRGYLATIVWFASSLLPNWILRLAFRSSSKLDMLSTLLKEQGEN